LLDSFNEEYIILLSPLKKRLFLFFLFAVLFFTYSQESDMNSGIIYGYNWSYMISAPDGWVLDDQSFASRGICGLFYQPSDTSVLVYINPVDKNPSKKIAFEDFVTTEQNRYLAASPNAKFELFKVVSSNGSETHIYKLTDDDRNSYEMVGYREESNAFFAFVLHTSDLKKLEDNIPPYLEIVEVFTYIPSPPN